MQIYYYSGYIEIDEEFVMLRQIEEGDTKGLLFRRVGL